MNRARHIEAYLARADEQNLEVQADSGYRVSARLGANHWIVDVTGLGPGARTVRLDEAALRNQHPDGVRVLALTGAGTLATGGQDGSVALWNIAQPARATVLRPPGASLASGWGPVSALSGDGQRLAAGYDGGRVAVWDLAKGGNTWRRPVASGRAHALRITDVALFDQGRQLATASRDGKARLWRLPSDPGADPAVLKTPAQELSAPADNTDWFAGYHSIAVSPDGSLAVAGTRGGRISVWRTADGVLWPRALLGHDDAVVRLVFTDDKQLLSGGWDGRVIRWRLDPERMQFTRNELLDLPSQITGLALAGRDQRLFASTEQGELLQMRFDAPRHPMARILSRGQDGAPPLLLALTGVTPPVAAATESGRLVILQAEAGNPASRRPVSMPAAPVRALDWARGARRLVVADDNGQVWMLAADGTGNAILPGVMAGTSARLTLSDDARLLAIRSRRTRRSPAPGTMAPAARRRRGRACRGRCIRHRSHRRSRRLPDPAARAAGARGLCYLPARRQRTRRGRGRQHRPVADRARRDRLRRRQGGHGPAFRRPAARPDHQSCLRRARRHAGGRQLSGQGVPPGIAEVPGLAGPAGARPRPPSSSRTPRASSPRWPRQTRRLSSPGTTMAISSCSTAKPTGHCRSRKRSIATRGNPWPPSPSATTAAGCMRRAPGLPRSGISIWSNGASRPAPLPAVALRPGRKLISSRAIRHRRPHVKHVECSECVDQQVDRRLY
ncbi:WD40 repeat domain-containing protein [Cupriavidus basilensis]